MPAHNAESVWGYDEPVDLQEAVFQALGAASMCWDPSPSNQVFDSTLAKAIGEALLRKIFELTSHPDAYAEGYENGQKAATTGMWAKGYQAGFGQFRERLAQEIARWANEPIPTQSDGEVR